MYSSIIERIPHSETTLFIQRLDRMNAPISGNKFYKLTHNLSEAKRKGYSKILTFGGAYSNHIYATAIAGKEYGFQMIGIMRGEKANPLNPTLAFAEKCGMKLHFISREQYQKKRDHSFINELKNQFGDFYLIPEGGTNELAVQGCEEIVKNIPLEIDYVICPVGTGGTISGIISGLTGNKKIIGIPVLKNNGFLEKEIIHFLSLVKKENLQNWKLVNEYSFGGYAKFDSSLIDFINQFYQKTKIPLDPIYTGKMMYGIYDLIQKGFFKKEEKILVIYTGGIQGIEGFNQRFGDLIKL